MRAAAIAVCGVTVTIGSLSAADGGEKLFAVDVNKQKAALEKDFTQADEFLNQTKLQNVRSQVELLQHKLKQMTPSLSKEEVVSYQKKIDNVVTRISAKEDSLIKVTMNILNSKGVDMALGFLQNDLRMFGVSEKKTSAAEKTILEEAPKIQQALERQAIDRAVKALQSGQPLDPDMDPYIIKTAERIIKAHTDSIAAIENAKARKELEEKQRQERIQREKEDKEKKLEEEKAAKIKQEEEKKRLAEQEIERKKTEAEEKEKQRLARIDEERQKKLQAQEEKSRKDSLAAAQKDSIAAAQRIAAQQAQQEKERQGKLTKQQREQERAAHAEEENRKDKLAKQEMSRKDSLTAAQKESIAAVKKTGKEQPQVQPTVQKQPQVPEAQPQQTAPISMEAKSYLKGLRDNQKKAQEDVMALYDLVEKKRNKEALEKFKQDRNFIAQFVDAQVFNVLEQTIAQAAISSQPETAVIASPPKPPVAVLPEQESIDKINSFMRDNNIEAAYAELKRTERSLRHFMARKDFKELKDMVERSYKIRKQAGKSR